jgi:Tol biopolymer transport system component
MRRPTLRTSALVAAIALALAAGFAEIGSATSVAVRTLRVFGNPSGPSADPALTPTGRFLAFDSQASDIVPEDPNGAIRDVFNIDRTAGTTRLVSIGLGGTGADGPSFRPAISDHGGRVVFTSLASNLVADDTNNAPDVFGRDVDGAIYRVSVASDGAQANGESFNADVSGDGRYVVFQSAASNLVPGDTNGQPDVFVRDIVEGKTTMISVARDGGPGNAASVAPAISEDGGAVSFFSSASDLTASDRNGVADIFIRDRDLGTTELVSVSSTGHAQDHSIATGFNQVSDLSRDGRYVAFDSDASTLVHHDLNHRTDVFVRDRAKKTTEIVSESNSGFEGNNDSFSPVITPSGRFVAFESLASNITPDDAKGEDIFVRDRHLETTSVADVSATGAPKGPEVTDQLLQRPALTSNAEVVAFASTASDLVADDTNSSQDIFLRLMTPPRGTAKLGTASGRRTVTLVADDPGATTFVCRVDKAASYDCPAGRLTLPRRGTTFRARAGGPGMLYDSHVLQVSLSNDRKAPSVKISPFTKTGLRTIRGTSSDAGSGVARVRVAVVYSPKKGACRGFDGARFVATQCRKRVYVTAQGRARWHVRLPVTVKGPVVVYARSVDRAGNTSPTRRRFAVVGRSRTTK